MPSNTPEYKFLVFSARITKLKIPFNSRIKARAQALQLRINTKLFRTKGQLRRNLMRGQAAKSLQANLLERIWCRCLYHPTKVILQTKRLLRLRNNLKSSRNCVIRKLLPRIKCIIETPARRPKSIIQLLRVARTKTSIFCSNNKMRKPSSHLAISRSPSVRDQLKFSFRTRKTCDPRQPSQAQICWASAISQASSSRTLVKTIPRCFQLIPLRVRILLFRRSKLRTRLSSLRFMWTTWLVPKL